MNMHLREHEASRHGNDTALAVSNRERAGPTTWTGRCDQHGGHTHLDVDPEEFTVAHDGLTWTLDQSDYVVSYCDECFRDTRDSFSNDVRRDADAIAVAKQVIRDCWRDVKRAFEPGYIAETDGIQHCPFCGTSLSAVDTGTPAAVGGVEATCPEHGPLNLRIQQVREPREEIEA